MRQTIAISALAQKSSKVKHHPPGTTTCHWCSDLPRTDGCCGQRSPVCYTAWGSAMKAWGSYDSNSKAAGWTASGRSCSAGTGQWGWHRSWWTPGYEQRRCRRSGQETCPPGERKGGQSENNSLQCKKQKCATVFHIYREISVCFWFHILLSGGISSNLPATLSAG